MHKCRVLAFNGIDGLYHVSFSSSSVDVEHFVYEVAAVLVPG